MDPIQTLYEHALVTNKSCRRKPGVGFEFEGQRLSGITAYLKNNYYPRFNAVRRNVCGKKGYQKKVSKLGLRMGTKADTAVTAFIKKKDNRKMANSPTAVRLIRCLAQLNLRTIDAHVLICEPRLGVATEIDVLCRDQDGMVVIENKTTLQTREEHEWSYKRSDRKIAHLLGDYATLANSEYTHQQLQVCYMLIMLELSYKIPAGQLKGYVLVASSDSLNVYPAENKIRALVRQTVTRRIMFGRTALVPDLPDLPLLKYEYRPYVPTQKTTLLECPPILARFLKPKKITAVLNFFIGAYSFYQRPDVVFEAFADFYAEDDENIYIFLCRQTTMTVGECAVATKPLRKLPSGQQSSPLTCWLLELAIVVCSGRHFKKKIHARLIINGPKPCMRTLPPRLLSRLK